MNSGLWSKLLKKTVITATFYFPADESMYKKTSSFWPELQSQNCFWSFQPH